MRLSVIISLGASAVLGTAALLIARVWIAPSNKSAGSKAPPATTAPVVLAGKAFVYGDQLDPKKLVVAQYPLNLVPPGSFRAIDQISAGSTTPPVALGPIAEHQPVLASDVSTTGGRKSVAILISPGMRAYTIHITDLTGVGGHVLPGDRVDVLLTRQPTSDKTGPETVRELTTQVLVQDVRVLGINMNADPQAAASTAVPNPNTATLEVNLHDAEQLSVASAVGTISFALRRTGSVEQEKVKPGIVADLAVPGVTGPIRRAGRATGISPAIPRSSVVIVHGDSAADVMVPVEGPGGT